MVRRRRHGSTGRSGPHGPLLAVLACAAVAATAPGARAASTPPAALFRPGYDLCRAVPLAALRRAGGERYGRGLFASGACIWQRADLRAGVTLSAHAPAVGAEVMRMYLARTDVRARRISVPGARRAVLVTLRRTTRYLFAAYRDGTVQVGMTAPGKPPAARLLAVLRLVVADA